MPSYTATSAKFPSPQAELGRQWNTQNPRLNHPLQCPTQVSEQMKHLVLIGDKCVLLSGIHLILILCYLSAGVVDPAEGLAHPERGRRRVHAGRAVPAAPRRRRRLQVDAHDQVLGGEGRGHVRLPGRRDESSVLCHIVQFVQLCCSQ